MHVCMYVCMYVCMHVMCMCFAHLGNLIDETEVCVEMGRGYAT